MGTRLRFVGKYLLNIVWLVVPILLAVFVAPSMPYAFAVGMVTFAVVAFAWELWRGVLEIRKAVDAAKKFTPDNHPPPGAP
jgi:hypothetical protein